MFRRLRLRQVAKSEPDDSGSVSELHVAAEQTPIEDQGRRVESSIPKEPKETDEGNPGNTDRKSIRKKIEIDGEVKIYSVAFHKNGKHCLGGWADAKIGRWRMEDGLEEHGMPMKGRGAIMNIAVSRDGKRLVSGGWLGEVIVWSVPGHFRVGEMKGHTKTVRAVDISPDGSKIASGSDDETASIWLRRTGERLLTLQHKYWLAAVKFSPDGSLLATATWDSDSVRVYNSEDGCLLVEFLISIGDVVNCSLAWDHDSKHLYAVSRDSKIHYLDASAGTTLSQWSLQIDDMECRGCIALPSNGTFIAASADCSITFWDTKTYTKIVSNIDYVDTILTMAISENYDIAIGHGKTITIRNLRDILPSFYIDNIAGFTSAGVGERGLSSPPQTEPSSEKITSLEKTVQELQNKLAELQGLYEARSHELTSTQKNLEASKLSNEDKDRIIDGLAARVDQWRRSDAAKAEELAAARKELEERRRDSQELISMRDELRFSQSQTIEIRQWYDEQLRQLKSDVEQSQQTLFPVQNFITKASAHAENAIIEGLQRLNENVQRSSAFMAECVARDFQPRGISPTEERTSTSRRLAESIGQPLVNHLQSDSRADGVGYLSVAFRAYFTRHLFGIISSWSVENGPNQLIRDIYSIIRDLESQTISGRWRSLTYAAISLACNGNPDMFITPIINGLADVVVTAGCAATVSDATTMITSKFQNRISFILATAGQLTKAIMDTISGDYTVNVIPAKETFDETTMEVDVGDGGGAQATPRGRRVLCTTQLGLSKEVVTQSKIEPNRKKNSVTAAIVVKSKVLLG